MLETEMIAGINQNYYLFVLEIPEKYPEEYLGPLPQEQIHLWEHF